MFWKGRYPAAFAAAVGIGFSALAVEESRQSAALAAGAPGADLGNSARGARVRNAIGQRAHVPTPLNRPLRRLRRTIDVQVREIRSERRRGLERTFAELPAGVSPATLDAIGSCESGGDPGAVSADGSYRGKYQFDTGTWAAVGGQGDPAAASEAEQDYRAALLYSQSGSSPWPNCAP